MAQDPTRHDATIPALDGFRALAIVIVMGSHVGLERVLPGQFGVTLFFFLSGYLITTLLRRELEASGRIDFGRFYLRRVVRILPPLYVTMAFMLALSAAGLIRPIKVAGLPFDFLFLSNYLPLSSMPIGLWSLAVEEHFYLGFPLLFFLFARRWSLGRCAMVFLTLCVVVLGVRLIEVQRLADFHNVNFWTHTRLDSILFGSVLALWNNPIADRDNVLPIGLTGYALAGALLLPTFVIRDEAFRQTWRYTVQGLGLLVLFNTAIRDRVIARAALDNKVARWIARLSYTLYLVHSGLVLLFTPEDGSHPILASAIAIACAFGYAVLMHRWVERPMARWRRKHERAVRPEPAGAEPDLVRS